MAGPHQYIHGQKSSSGVLDPRTYASRTHAHYSTLLSLIPYRDVLLDGLYHGALIVAVEVLHGRLDDVHVPDLKNRISYRRSRCMVCQQVIRGPAGRPAYVRGAGWSSFGTSGRRWCCRRGRRCGRSGEAGGRRRRSAPGTSSSPSDQLMDVYGLLRLRAFSGNNNAAASCALTWT